MVALLGEGDFLDTCADGVGSRDKTSLVGAPIGNANETDRRFEARSVETMLEVVPASASLLRCRFGAATWLLAVVVADGWRMAFAAAGRTLLVCW